MHFIKVLHLIVALKLLRIDATVTITQTGVDAGNGYFECGETLILTCEISGNSGSMTWQNDSSSSPLAQCVGNICEVNPDLADKFDFSANVSIGIYNLTFVVTNDNNGSTYVCDDGNNNFNMSHISVRDLRPTLIQTNQNKLKAVSGCINENENCEFKWKKIKANNSEESVYDISCLNEEESVEAAACVLDEECGGLDLIQKVMTIDDGKGGPDDYYLKVVLSCNGVEMESVQTSDTHKVTFIETGSEICYLVFIALFWLIDIVAAYVFISYSLHSTERDWKKSCVYILTAFAAVIPLHVNFALTVVLFSECSDNKCSKICTYFSFLGSAVMIYIFLRFVIGFLIVIFHKEKEKSCMIVLVYIPPPVGIIIIIFLCCFCCWLVIKDESTNDKATSFKAMMACCKQHEIPERGGGSHVQTTAGPEQTTVVAINDQTRGQTHVKHDGGNNSTQGSPFTPTKTNNGNTTRNEDQTLTWIQEQEKKAISQTRTNTVFPDLPKNPMLTANLPSASGRNEIETSKTSSRRKRGKRKRQDQKENVSSDNY